MSYVLSIVRYPSKTSLEKLPPGFVKFAKKVVASWLSCKVGTLKAPLRAHRVTGTEKFWQCFATTELARRAEATNDGRYIVSRRSNEPLRRRGGGKRRSDNAQDWEERMVEVAWEECGGGIQQESKCGEEVFEGKEAVVMFTYRVSGLATILNTFASFTTVLLQQISPSPYQ